MRTTDEIGFLIDRVGRRPLLLSMISLMAAVMVVQTGLIYNVQNSTSIAKSCGAAAAAMLFLFQGAFTIGMDDDCLSSRMTALNTSQASRRLSGCTRVRFCLSSSASAVLRYLPHAIGLWWDPECIEMRTS